MKTLNELKKDRTLINLIDWDMTPEEAVRLYLEWGNNWARSNYVIKSKGDITYYFAVNTWKEKPIIYLICRNSEYAKEVAAIEIPEKLKEMFFSLYGNHKGVFALEGDLKNWLKKELGFFQ